MALRQDLEVASKVSASVANEPVPGTTQHREELELAAAAAAELTRLRRQLRQAQLDLQSWKRTDQQELERQRRDLSRLEDERKTLQNKIQAFKSAQKEPPGLQLLLHKYDKAKTKLKEARERRDKLQQLSQELEKRYYNLKIQSSPNKEKSVNNELRQRQRIAENRLDQVTTQYNKMLVRNNAIRKELDELMRDRDNFISILNELQEKRNSERQAVERLYEDATTTFLEREECRAKLKLLQDRLETTKLQGQRELREYKRLLSHDEKLGRFLEIKNQPRSVNFTKPPAPVEEPAGTEKEDFEQYREWQLVLKREMNEMDPRNLAEQYVKQVEESFLLYSMLNQKTKEVEILEKEILAVKQDSDGKLPENTQENEILEKEPEPDKLNEEKLEQELEQEESIEPLPVQLPALRQRRLRSFSYPHLEMDQSLTKFRDTLQIASLKQIDGTNIPQVCRLVQSLLEKTGCSMDMFTFDEVPFAQQGMQLRIAVNLLYNRVNDLLKVLKHVSNARESGTVPPTPRSLTSSMSASHRSRSVTSSRFAHKKQLSTLSVGSMQSSTNSYPLRRRSKMNLSARLQERPLSRSELEAQLQGSIKISETSNGDDANTSNPPSARLALSSPSSQVST